MRRRHSERREGRSEDAEVPTRAERRKEQMERREGVLVHAQVPTRGERRNDGAIGVAADWAGVFQKHHRLEEPAFGGGATRSLSLASLLACFLACLPTLEICPAATSVRKYLMSAPVWCWECQRRRR